MNVTDAPAINGFIAAIIYNTAVLAPTPLDYTGNVLSSFGNPFVVRNCVSGTGPVCKGDDGPGIVALGLALLGATTTSPTSGTLYKVTFNIIGSGFSEIHFIRTILTNGIDQSETGLPSTSFDGYFTNVDCPPPSGNRCSPLNVDFTTSPNLLLQGKILTFNASARTVNPSASIRNYHWTWGDNTLPQNAARTNTTHVYAVGAAYYVTLTATDTAGISSSKTKRINVLNLLVDLAIDSLNSDRDQGLLPGTVVKITTVVANFGTHPQDANLTISVEGKTLGNITFHGLGAGFRKEFTTQWPSTGYSPRVYRIDAFVDYVRDPSNHTRIIEDILNNNLVSIYIQLVTASPAGLSLLPSASIATLFVVGAVFAGSRLLRKRPLDTSLP